MISSRISIPFNNGWCFLSLPMVESFSLLVTPQWRSRPERILTLLYSSLLLKHSIQGWELFLLKQMQITKCPEFTIQQFWEKGNRGVVSSGYIESHLSFSQRGEPSHLRLNSLNRDFRGSYGVCVVNKEKGSRQFSSPMTWIDLWERLFSSAEKSWFELFFHWY